MFTLPEMFLFVNITKKYKNYEGCCKFVVKISDFAGIGPLPISRPYEITEQKVRPLPMYLYDFINIILVGMAGSWCV